MVAGVRSESIPPVLIVYLFHLTSDNCSSMFILKLFTRTVLEMSIMLARKQITSHFFGYDNPSWLVSSMRKSNRIKRISRTVLEDSSYNACVCSTSIVSVKGEATLLILSCRSISHDEHVTLLEGYLTHLTNLKHHMEFKDVSLNEVSVEQCYII